MCLEEEAIVTNKIDMTPDGSRRRFILAAGGAGAAGIAAALLPAGSNPPEQQSAEGPSRRGYRLTSHISAYYRTARV